MPDKRIKAVLFDLGETLLNFGKVDTTELFKEGAVLSYDFLKSKGQPVGNFNLYYWRNLMSLRIHYWLYNIVGRDFDALALFKKISTKKGVTLNESQWQHLAWLWYEPLYKTCTAEPKIKETLTTLKDSGLKLGIVSNTFVHSSSLEKHLQNLSLLDFFPVRLYSYEFGFRKPDARIFKIAAERIGETLENIVFVGDRIDADVKPAVKAGMQPVLKTAYTNTGRKIPKGVSKINQLSELPTLIERINAGM